MLLTGISCGAFPLQSDCPIELDHRGGSRAFSRRDAIPGRGHLPNTLIQFSEKSNEIKEILVRRGGAENTPLRSATGSGYRFHIVQ